MGFFTGLLTAPLAPVRGVVWIASTLMEEAQRQWTDPAVVRGELDAVHQRWESGEISADDRDQLEDQLVQRLISGRAVGHHG
jgi:hypothetical protein